MFLQIVLETEITNKPALRLYENLGFVRDKRLFRYYLNGVDALRLKLWLRWNLDTKLSANSWPCCCHLITYLFVFEMFRFLKSIYFILIFFSLYISALSINGLYFCMKSYHEFVLKICLVMKPSFYLSSFSQFILPGAYNDLTAN